jgi:hypothetical protein
MKNRVLKQTLIAVAILSSASLMSAAASAGSIHDEGYFGGGYSYIGPGPYSQRSFAGRIGPLHERRAYVYAYRPYYRPYVYAYRPYYYARHYDYSPYDVGPVVVLPGFAIY